MDIEQAMVLRARPFMLAAKAQARLQAEVSKGCTPDLHPGPVALEPRFEPIGEAESALTHPASTYAIPEMPPSSADIVRLQVWLSPDQRFDWNRSELFVKQLVGVNHRLAMEVVGNQELVVMALLCHRADLPIVWSAFHGEFDRCQLTPVTEAPLGRFSSRDWAGMVFRDFFPTPP